MAELNAITNNPNYEQPTTVEGPPYGSLFIQLYPSSYFRLWAREGGPLVDEFVRFCFAFVLKMKMSDLVSRNSAFSSLPSAGSPCEKPCQKLEEKGEPRELTTSSRGASLSLSFPFTERLAPQKPRHHPLRRLRLPPR